jgi:signal transduction histidine kinase
MTSRFIILNVDQSESNRSGRSRILREAGYEVHEASNGADALRLASEMAPDLVLLDPGLPDIGGMEVCRRIKSNPATASTMVLHISPTIIERSDRTPGLANGADACLIDPADTAGLLAGVHALLRLRQAENRLRTATQEWRNTFDAVEEGVFLLDRDGMIRRVNQSFYRSAMEERDRLLAAEQAARTEAESASRVKDDFLSAVSHDLRGPLQSILIWTELLRDPNMSVASRLRTVDSLDRSAQAQRQLIDDLLDMSRIISGRLKMSLSQCDVRSILLLTMETGRPAAEARGVALEVDLDPAGAPALCDPDRMRQVFRNLLANAIKFTPKGGRVQVRLERTGELVRIRVSDNGEGIDPGFLPHVFDHFQYGENAPGGRNAALGLGLSIARRLVELHGGSIEAESPGKGQGSVFTVTLPLNPDPGRSARDASFPARS